MWYLGDSLTRCCGSVTLKAPKEENFRRSTVPETPPLKKPDSYPHFTSGCCETSAVAYAVFDCFTIPAVATGLTGYCKKMWVRIRALDMGSGDLIAWAEYAILTAERGCLCLDFYRVPYDVEQPIQIIRSSGRMHANQMIAE